jgi:hypothetical protein
VKKFAPSEKIKALEAAARTSVAAPSIVPEAGVMVTTPEPMFSTPQRNSTPSVAAPSRVTATVGPCEKVTSFPRDAASIV